MANDGTVKIGTELDDSGFKSGLSKLGSVAKGALKGTVAAVGGVATAASGAVAGLLALESATEEYRIAQGKLNTAFEAAGYGTEAAAQAYNDFYEILGETDTATEASQLLAKLADSQEDLSTWTRIAAGVNGTFGDSLPIEGLIEASNETAKVGTVTGVLADALNWAGISEDEFNDKLAACTDESERNQLIMDTLATTYDEASDAFYRNNAALVEARKAQAQMDDALAELGGAVSDVKTRMIGEFLPSISKVTTGLAGMLTGTEGAEQQFSQGIGSLIDAAVARLPEFLNFGAQILVAILNGLVSNIPVVVSAIPQIVSSIVSAFSQMGPQLSSAGSQLLSMLASGIMTGLPVLAESAVNLMGNLSQYIKDNFPTLIATGLDALVSFSSSLRENAGLIVDGALSLIQSLASGLISSLPIIIETVPQIVTNIAGIINDNAPKLVLTAAELIGKLAIGLIQAIPTLVENIPQIIEAIVAVFTAFNWVNLGKTIITALKNGIVSMVSSAKSAAGDILKAVNDGLSALPSNLLNLGKQGITGLASGIKGMIGSISNAAKSIAETILSNLKSLPSQALNIGKNLLEGLWNGISNKIEWLKDKVSGVVDTIKGWFTGSDGFDTHSPSKWSMSVMEYVMDGLAIGAKNRAGEVLETVEDIVDEIKDRVDSISDALEFRQDIGDLEYELWERTVGKAATEEEKYAKQLELLSDQQVSQKGIVDAAAAAYQAVAEQYGENSAESYEYQKALLEEMLAYQDLIDKVNELIEAKSELSGIANEIPSAAYQVEASNASIVPASVSAPQHSVETAVNNAAEMTALSQYSNGQEVVFEIDGRQFARGYIPYHRVADKQTPEISFA